MTMVLILVAWETLMLIAETCTPVGGIRVDMTIAQRLGGDNKSNRA